MAGEGAGSPINVDVSSVGQMVIDLESGNKIIECIDASQARAAAATLNWAADCVDNAKTLRETDVPF